MLLKLRRLSTWMISMLACGSAFGQVDIHWWHSMTAVNREWVEDLARDFNRRQAQFRIIPIYKGPYDEAMATTIEAVRTGTAPHIVQVFEVGTATMMASRGVALPASQVFKASGRSLNPAKYVPAVAGYYTAPNGHMLSLPFNSSTTVTYYNKDAFRAAGLDPERAPTTWPMLREAAERLKAAGHSCPFTTAWQGWTQLESFSTWHNVEFASQRNGLAGLDARLQVDSALHIRHISHLADMARKGLFVYKGRANLPESAFVTGECAIITSSSGMYGHAKKLAKFDFGLGPLPYYPDVPGAPQNTVLGGASLWVIAGKRPTEYQGVAAFFDYLSLPDVQAASHQRTGYLPITMEAFRLTERSGFYRDNPGTDVAVNQMVRKLTDRSRGIRLGNYQQIRLIEDEELELVWSGSKPPKEALASIVSRGNEQLHRFERANKR